MDQTASPSIGLRSATAADRGFLRALYGQVRAEELSLVDWSQDDKDAFIDMQFAAQDAYYREYYPDASFDIVEVDGIAVGRLYVDRWPREIRVVDISILATQRNAGIGTRLLRRLQQEAAESARALSVHVEIFNPARGLYERLGFLPVEDKGVYLLMQWTASASGDDGLVAHAGRVRPEGDEEQLELTETGVAQQEHLLRDEPSLGGVEQQRERHAVDATAPLLGRAVPGLGAAAEDEGEARAVGQRDVEPVADERGERLAGERFDHTGQANEPLTANVRQETR